MSGLLALLAGPSPAVADTGTSPGSPAILSPLLTTFAFGASVGAPEVCGIAMGGLEIGLSGYPQLAQPLSPGLSEVSAACAKLATAVTAYVNGFNAAVAPLAAINPTVNPGLEAFATGLQNAGTTLGPSIAPLGPTLSGLGADVRYFEGS